ncbi:MAG TPA: hypothetical protein VFO55_12880 [Gemmatimonadaceae bacterium]|nr:hypothetical protein [Gemmatimonadaceae bacterium]
MNRLQSVVVLLGAALLASCDLFGDTGVRDLTAPLPSARVKFHNFSPSSVGVNFFANDTKMTAILTSACIKPATAADSTRCATTGIESTVGVAYANAASGGRYDAIAPGQYTLAAKTASGGEVVSTVAAQIAEGKYYTFVLSGVYNATSKTADSFIIEDPVPAEATDYTVATVRFVNAVSNGTGDLNLLVTNTETSAQSAIGGAVAYKSGGSFVTVPAGTYNLAARYTGATGSLISRTAVPLLGGRVYTITSRGSTATASTLGLDLTENQR